MSEANENIFGRILAKELEKRAWDKPYFAAQIDVSDTTVGRWIGGRSLPKSTQRRKLMEVLGMTLQELGLIEEETNQQESILEDITEILQKTDDTSTAHRKFVPGYMLAGLRSRLRRGSSLRSSCSTV